MSTPDLTSRFGQIRARVAEYYTGKLRAHGATPQGVDWNSAESQTLRFEQLTKLLHPGETFSLNDYGCGYGALADHLLDRGLKFEYRGLDVSAEMVAQASSRLVERLPCRFFTDAATLPAADYTLASGIFNVKLNAAEAEWTEYVLQTLDQIDAVSTRGFAFNVLTLYSDPEKRRPDLYYADPLFLFDRCKRQVSTRVALLHDYPLYEFTLLVRK